MLEFDLGAGGFARHRAASCRNHDGFGGRCQPELDGNSSRRGSRHIGPLRGETLGKNPHGIGSGTRGTKDRQSFGRAGFDSEPDRAAGFEQFDLCPGDCGRLRIDDFDFELGSRSYRQQDE